MPNVILFPAAEETVYVKLKVSFTFAKDRLYRTLLVKPHTNLFDLGCAICMAFGAEFEHLFSFSAGRQDYIPSMLLEDDFDDALPMEEHYLDELGSTFRFCYDFGDDWEFSCRVYKKEEIRKEQKTAILLEGKGQGIWEDNIVTLYAYLSGEIGPNVSKKDEEYGFSLPWNFKNKRYSDFDLPVDIEKLQKKLDTKLKGTVEFLKDQMESDDDEDNAFEPMKAVQSMTEFLLSALDAQIDSVPFVSETLRRLEKRYDEETAYKILTDAFMQEFRGLLFQKEKYGTEIYKERLKNLK